MFGTDKVDFVKDKNGKTVTKIIHTGFFGTQEAYIGPSGQTTIIDRDQYGRVEDVETITRDRYGNLQVVETNYLSGVTNVMKCPQGCMKFCCRPSNTSSRRNLGFNFCPPGCQCSQCYISPLSVCGIGCQCVKCYSVASINQYVKSSQNYTNYYQNSVSNYQNYSQNYQNNSQRYMNNSQYYQNINQNNPNFNQNLNQNTPNFTGSNSTLNNFVTPGLSQCPVNCSCVKCYRQPITRGKNCLIDCICIICVKGIPSIVCDPNCSCQVCKRLGYTQKVKNLNLDQPIWEGKTKISINPSDFFSEEALTTTLTYNFFGSFDLKQKIIQMKCMFNSAVDQPIFVISTDSINTFVLTTLEDTINLYTKLVLAYLISEATSNWLPFVPFSDDILGTICIKESGKGFSPQKVRVNKQGIASSNGYQATYFSEVWTNFEISSLNIPHLIVKSKNSIGRMEYAIPFNRLTEWLMAFFSLVRAY